MTAITPFTFPKAGTHVRFTKLSEKTPGLVDVGYWTVGHLVDDVRVGEAIWMNRYERAAQGDESDPARRAGLFNTSTVESIAADVETVGKDCLWIITTRNSTWQLEVLPESASP